MQKIYKLLVITLLSIGSFLLSIHTVKALSSTFTKDFIGTYHYVTEELKWGDFEKFTAKSGARAYCIEPGHNFHAEITYEGFNNLSLEEYASKLNISKDQIEKISLIAHFGYGYSSHNSNEWIVATQALIWDTLEYKYSFTSKNNPSDPDQYKINTPNEIKTKMTEIDNLITNYLKTPSFENKKLSLGTSTTISDKNQVLANFKVESCTNCEAKINGNNLIITPKNTEKSQVKLVKKSTGWDSNFIIYTSNESQNLIVPGLVNAVTKTISFNVTGGSINLTKLDSLTKTCATRENASLKGAVYKLYKDDDTYIDSLTIDDECNSSYSNLPIGNYYLLEDKAGLNYELDSEKHYFSITESKTTANLTVYDKPMLGKVVLTKVDADTNTCLNRGAATLKGAIYGVYKENGSLVTKLTINANCQAESQKELPLGNYYVKELSAPKGYKLDPKTYNFNITQNNYQNDIKLTLKDEIYKTTLVINKTYLTKNGVSAEVGATFDIISKTTNSKIATLTIDKSAQAKTILVYDDYIIRQTKTVSGYHLAQDIDFKVNEESEEFSYITLMNEPYTALIKVIKINELGKKVKLANIKFKIKDLDTNEYLCQYQNYPNKTKICTFKTDKNGEFITPNILYPGHYKLEEVDEPIEGYLWNKEGLKFTIDEFTSLKYDKDIGYYLPLEFINKEVKGNINIIKLGEKLVLNDNTYKYETIFLDGILYGLYDEHYNLIGTYETDINGKININNLKLGKYILKELKTKEGYILDLKEYIINLTYKDQYTSIISQDLTLNNYLFKGKLEITKKDLDTNLPLKGVKINIYDIDQNKLIYSGITNKDGKIIIDNLYLGKFYLQEIESLTGYKLNNQNIYFELTANNELKKIDITNEMIKGKLLIHKKDQNNLPLAGVSFNLYDINDNLITTLITDQNGFISIDLKYGKYYLKEISTLDNYELNSEKIYFSITKEGEIIEQTLTNNRLKITVPDTLKENNTLPFLIIFISTLYYLKKKKI